jgi:RNA polymerase sigma-70 factor, ECF subfamily
MTLSTTEIWDEFGHILLSFISKRVAVPEDADDILQDVFIKIHSRIDTLQDSERLVPWLYQIARHTIIDYYRRRKPVIVLPELAVVEEDPFEEEPAAQLAAGLHEFLTCLPEKYQRAVTLSELEGLKQADVAERLGISLSGAKSRVQRGRQLLKEALLDCCHFEFDRRGSLSNYISRQECCVQCRS